MNNILEVNNLCKKYKNFTLNNVNFSIPYGSIMGFVGENGAGKSTTINSILNLIKKDGGTITLLGKEMLDSDTTIRDQIGVVFDRSHYYEKLTAKKIGTIMANIYSNWNQPLYLSYLDKFQIPFQQQLKQFSKGMEMKFSIAIALSHEPKLLILDEATSGLDPIIRDEILDIFLGFVQDEKHAILLSSHITNDLEKIADYITFIHKGTIVFSESKDTLIYGYGILKCGQEQFTQLDKKDIISWRKHDFSWNVLVKDKEKISQKYNKVIVDQATVDDIMLLHIKGERP